MGFLRKYDEILYLPTLQVCKSEYIFMTIKYLICIAIKDKYANFKEHWLKNVYFIC